MNKLFAITISLLVASALPRATGRPFVAHDEEHAKEYEKLTRHVARYKSFMQGIAEGFYDDPQYINNNECLNEDAIETIHSIFESMRHGANFIDKMLRVITAMLTFNASVKESCNEH